VHRSAVSIVVLTIATGCDKPAPPMREAAPVAPSTSEATMPAPPPVPPDIDITPISKQLKCGGSVHKDVCRVLDEFAKAERWKVQMPSGEGRWIGTAYQLEKGADKTELLLLSARVVPTNQTSPGDLPLRVGTGPVPDDVRTAGAKLASALSRGDTVPRNNPALAFSKTWVSGHEYAVLPTTGPSVRLVAERETYLRQGAAQKIILVQPRQGADSTAGDGMYAEVWPTSW
jgi:hypothetical protein